MFFFSLKTRFQYNLDSGRRQSSHDLAQGWHCSMNTAKSCSSPPVCVYACVRERRHPGEISEKHTQQFALSGSAHSHGSWHCYRLSWSPSSLRLRVPCRELPVDQQLVTKTSKVPTNTEVTLATFPSCCDAVFGLQQVFLASSTCPTELPRYWLIGNLREQAIEQVHLIWWPGSVNVTCYWVNSRLHK